ncbi:hypothetical protein LTR66_008694, partial [Elasticomyces elasticus]
MPDGMEQNGKRPAQASPDGTKMNGEKPSQSAKPWTKAEDRILLDARRGGMPYKFIAAKVKKTILACRLHVHQMKLRAEKEKEQRLRQSRSRSRSYRSTRSPTARLGSGSPQLRVRPSLSDRRIRSRRASAHAALEKRAGQKSLLPKVPGPVQGPGPVQVSAAVQTPGPVQVPAPVQLSAPVQVSAPGPVSDVSCLPNNPGYFRTYPVDTSTTRDQAPRSPRAPRPNLPKYDGVGRHLPPLTCGRVCAHDDDVHVSNAEAFLSARAAVAARLSGGPAPEVEF